MSLLQEPLVIISGTLTSGGSEDGRAFHGPARVQLCLVVTNSHQLAHPCIMELCAWGGKAGISPFTSSVTFLPTLDFSIHG